MIDNNIHMFSHRTQDIDIMIYAENDKKAQDILDEIVKNKNDFSKENLANIIKDIHINNTIN